MKRHAHAHWPRLSSLCTIHPYFSKYFHSYRTHVIPNIYLSLCVRVVIVVFLSSPFPNKFNLNCLQPAHALDTRQPHLRYCIFCLWSWLIFIPCSVCKCLPLRESMCAFVCMWESLEWMYKHKAHQLLGHQSARLMCNQRAALRLDFD